MVCFLSCFTTSKRPKQHNSDKEETPSKALVLKTSEVLQLIEPPKLENAGRFIKLIIESKEEVGEQINCSAKKRVTFDLNVKVCEESVSEDAKEVSCDLVESEEKKKCGYDEEEPKEMEPILDTLALSKVVSYTPNNRYQDCRKSTDESEDIGLEESDLDEEDDTSEADEKGVVVLQEESSESLFSLSIDSRKQVCDVEKGEKEVTSPMPKPNFSEEKVKTIGSCRNAGKRSQFGHISVLNPIENLTQWKEEVKEERPISPLLKHEEKENIGLRPSFKPENHSSKSKFREIKAVEQEVGVDTSLSSWLVGSETTPKSNGSSGHSLVDSDTEKENSSGCLKDGLVLGEVAGFSASSSSSRGARSQSPDTTTPTIGTVGSYWIHTGQEMDSDSSSSCRGMPVRAREKDQTVNCKSTPFEARLNRALDMGVC